MSTPTVTTSSPVREGPQAPTLEPEGLTPSPENRTWGLLKSFLAKTGLIDALRARGRGLSTAAHPNNRLEHQAKLILDTTSNETRFRLFSGGQLGRQLGVNWGSINLRDPLGGRLAPGAAAFVEAPVRLRCLDRGRQAHPCLGPRHHAANQSGGDRR